MGYNQESNTINYLNLALLLRKQLRSKPLYTKRLDIWTLAGSIPKQAARYKYLITLY